MDRSVHARNVAVTLSFAALVALVALVVAAPAALAGPDVPARDYVAAMEHAHHGEAATPTPAVEPAPAQPVESEEVVYATLDGKPIRGFLAKPAKTDGPLPGLIVIQEWWGLNDQIRAMTRRLAGEGYVALAVDLYEGTVAGSSDEASAAMKRATADGARLVEHLRGAERYLSETAKASRVGSIGCCFGGAMSLRAAIELGDALDAAVVYYGQPVADPKDLAKIRAPILGLYGGKDTGIPIDGVRAMEGELKKLGKSFEVVVYENADHAFANSTGARYDASAAEDAWRRATAFLGAKLK